jgi:hypothetical protein
MAVPTTTFRGGALEVDLLRGLSLAALKETAFKAAKLLIVARNFLLFIANLLRTDTLAGPLTF